MFKLLLLSGAFLIFGTCVQCLDWVHVNMETDVMPKMALRIGRDSNGKIYLGRANFMGDLLPANVIPDKKICYVTFRGIATQLKECEVLFYDKSQGRKLSWRQYKDGEIPQNAIAIGIAKNDRNDNEPLYFGRVNYGDLIIPGKVHRSHKVCYYPIGSEEKHLSTYECLLEE